MAGSDLGTRALSGVVMILIAGAMLWLGSWPFTALIVSVGALAWTEWLRLARGQPNTAALVAFGTIYIAAATFGLIMLRAISVGHALLPIVVTIATDIGAYFMGRSVGGPKIAPAISPSKTWSGLVGGMIAAAAVTMAWTATFAFHGKPTPFGALAIGAIGSAMLAIVAQAGDFGESWMKRRAGVKDSGTLIPGHGGVLDRIDGLLAVSVACTAAWFALAMIVE